MSGYCLLSKQLKKGYLGGQSFLTLNTLFSPSPNIGNSASCSFWQSRSMRSSALVQALVSSTPEQGHLHLEFTGCRIRGFFIWRARFLIDITENTTWLSEPQKHRGWVPSLLSAHRALQECSTLALVVNIPTLVSFSSDLPCLIQKKSYKLDNYRWRNWGSDGFYSLNSNSN